MDDLNMVFWSAFVLIWGTFFVGLLVVCLRLRRRNCPDCGRQLSAFQSPFTKTWRMWFAGGYLCRNCGCETNIAGAKVTPGTGPRPGLVILYVSLMVALAAASAGLLFVSLSTQEPAPPQAAAPPLVEQAPPIKAPPGDAGRR
jgi:hypothetical protein